MDARPGIDLSKPADIFKTKLPQPLFLQSKHNKYHLHDKSLDQDQLYILNPYLTTNKTTKSTINLKDKFLIFSKSNIPNSS